MGRLERIQQQDDVLVVQTFQNLDLLAQVVHLLLSFAAKRTTDVMSGFCIVCQTYRLVINLSATIWPLPFLRPL